ncbi:hypothetical protein [Hoeflea prorocentri]|uniref:Uncharacterized protein n=1 Tax=Hoeflea prorocentri TaxID=1922333 RepID=A0A9X3UFB3_9HYPH|nr:hypothetical protein [Hoeflea prorocentri]MCY6380222.1 hypothetical protein [Hoeflea prorocentri]MDA5398022.1 hypothetical protein [Hoeflea prorocentri]
MTRSTFCYVVVDPPGSEIYADLSIISSNALRKLHPDAQIIWLSCKGADEFNAQLREELSRLEIEVRCIFRDKRYPFLTSRYIKTQIRQLVDGDFLFLDADTLPISNIDHLFATEADIALAWDVDGEPWSGQLSRWTNQSTYRELGWRHHDEGYFNSGVALFKDTCKAHEVGKLWHRSWYEARIKCGRLQDQPSLNYVLSCAAPTIEVLPGAYNAIIGKPEEGWLDGARIMHFCCSNYDGLPQEHMVLRKLLDVWRRDGRFDVDTFLQCVETESPFLVPS